MKQDIATEINNYFSMHNPSINAVLQYQQMLEQQQLKIPLTPETKPGVYFIEDFIKEDRN